MRTEHTFRTALEYWARFARVKLVDAQAVILYPSYRVKEVPLFFVRWWFYMWHLLCHYLFLISPFLVLLEAVLRDCGISLVPGILIYMYDW